jgi:hypothetical protein
MPEIFEHHFRDLRQDDFNEIFNLQHGIIVALNFCGINAFICIADSPDIQDFSALTNLGNKLDTLRISNCDKFSNNSIMQIFNHTNATIKINGQTSVKLDDNQLEEFIQDRRLTIAPSTSIAPIQYDDVQKRKESNCQLQ